jgi:hypothetical protein
MRVRVNQPPHHKTRLSIPASKWAVAHFAELKRGLGSACKNLIRKYNTVVGLDVALKGPFPLVGESDVSRNFWCDFTPNFFARNIKN